MKRLLPAIALLVFYTSSAQSKDEKEILDLLDKQTKAWNRADMNAFMEGYLPGDSLMFIGKNGVTYGYQSTLDNYKKNYSDTAQMGRLSFEILHVNRLSPEYYFVVGKWQLNRSVGNIGGHFTLIFRKIKGRWMIISDHSS
jgi:ketosteroid isomerase-like protein